MPATTAKAIHGLTSEMPRKPGSGSSPRPTRTVHVGELLHGEPRRLTEQKTPPRRQKATAAPVARAGSASLIQPDSYSIASRTAEQASSHLLHSSAQIRQCSWCSAWRSHSSAQATHISLHEETCTLAVAGLYSV
jgi:hypothetical protein